MTNTPLKLAIILGSNREGRFGHVVGRWIAEHATRHGGFDIDYIDLADIDLPAVLPDKLTPALEAYVARLDAADGFIVITPEYNHSYPAGLKQAIDLAHNEWMAKAVGFVSYGGLSGGLRAVEHLRQVFAELHAVGIRDTVSFHMAHGLFDDEGQLLEPEGPAMAANRLLSQLDWWATALRNAREARPYGT